jgi:hypothetical protein
MYTFARRLAWIAAFALPLGETWRRWGALWVEPLAYLDDIVVGALFLIGAWMANRGEVGRRWLAAAYGFATGLMALSLAGGVIAIGRTDPSGLSGPVAVAIKIAMMVLAIVGLLISTGGFTSRPSSPTPT